MPETVGREELVAILRGAVREIKENHETLSALDSHGGDGDHGTSMVRAMEQIEKVLSRRLTDEDGNPLVEGQEHRYVAEQAHEFRLSSLDIRSPRRKEQVEKIYDTMSAATILKETKPKAIMVDDNVIVRRN